MFSVTYNFKILIRLIGKIKVNKNYIVYRSIGLTAEIDSTGSIAAIEAAIDRLNKQRNELEELWAVRKMKLDLYLRLRVFERDALEVTYTSLSSSYLFIIFHY